MAVITVIGTGPGPLSYLTKEAERELLFADKVFFRMSRHPVYTWLKENHKRLVSFEMMYAIPRIGFDEIYEFIVNALMQEAMIRGKAVYALPGSPFVLEDTTRLLKLQAVKRIDVKVIPGVSFLDLIYEQVNIDFTAGVQIVLPYSHLQHGAFDERRPLVVCQIECMREPHDEPKVELTMRWLLRKYPPEHNVQLIWTDGYPQYETTSKAFPLKDLVREYGPGKFFASLYVPPVHSHT